MKIIVEIAASCSKWKAHKDIMSRSFIKKVADRVLSEFPALLKVKTFELSLLLTDEEEMLRLNSQFRGRKKATNVLSFPDTELNMQHSLELSPKLDYIYLGDIAFGYQVVYDESIAGDISFNDHFTHLLVHSILHLIGFDHQTKGEAERMEELEVKILKGFNINSPY